MRPTLENEHVRLSIDFEDDRWEVVSKSNDATKLSGVSVGCKASKAGMGKPRRHGFQFERFCETHGIDEHHGEFSGLNLYGCAEGFPMEVRLRFILPQSSSFLIWQTKLINQANSEVRISRMTHSESRPAHLHEGSDRTQNPRVVNLILAGAQPDSWYMNGWQSWSFSGTIKSGVRLLTGTRLGPATMPMYLNPTSTKFRSGYKFYSELYGIIGSQSERKGILLGMLSEQKAFGSLFANFGSDGTFLNLSSALEGVCLRPEEEYLSERAYLQFIDLSNPEGELDYLQAAARENRVSIAEAIPAGWSSWYYYFDEVEQDDVIQNLAWVEQHAESIPIELIQLDDGYQKKVGDWLETNPEFSIGHKPLVDAIDNSGYLPGLWLAPFVADAAATISKDHPDWILRKNGRPVIAGFNWGSFFYALDITHPQVLEYIQRVVRTVVSEWGYRYLKLDFLYAAALPGDRWQPAQSGAEALRRGLETIKNCSGDGVYLAASGCPLGPAIGLVDSMRIGPDVAPRWLPAYRGIEFIFKKEPSLPSLRNNLQNTLSRAPMDGVWWHNDPDCLLMRAKDTKLTEAEAQLMVTTTALTSSVVVLSDNLSELSVERQNWASRLLPPINGRTFVIDRLRDTRACKVVQRCQGALGHWHLLAVINWFDDQRAVEFQPRDAGLEPKQYFAFDYWREELAQYSNEKWLIEVPAHGVRLFQIRPRVPGWATWLGDTLHISGGQVVQAWIVSQGMLRAELNLGRKGSGSTWLHLPGQVQRATFDGSPVGFDLLGGGIVRIDFFGISSGELLVEWQ